MGRIKATFSVWRKAWNVLCDLSGTQQTTRLLRRQFCMYEESPELVGKIQLLVFSFTFIYLCKTECGSTTLQISWSIRFLSWCTQMMSRKSCRLRWQMFTDLTWQKWLCHWACSATVLKCHQRASLTEHSVEKVHVHQWADAVCWLALLPRTIIFMLQSNVSNHWEIMGMWKCSLILKKPVFLDSAAPMWTNSAKRWWWFTGLLLLH